MFQFWIYCECQLIDTWIDKDGFCTIQTNKTTKILPEQHFIFRKNNKIRIWMKI